jgi:hypothetical protein
LESQKDLFSSLGELDVVQHLLADLHDDLSGKVERARQLADICGHMGAGTMLYGGEITLALWREVRWAFIHGQYVGTIMLSQGLAEQILAAYLDIDINDDRLPRRVAFAETLRRCLDKKVLSSCFASDLQTLMAMRNPLSHFRSMDDPTNLSRRVLDTLEPADAHLRKDATYAMRVAADLLALPTFRL